MQDETPYHLYTLNALFESLEEAVLMHDLEYNILQWNPASQDIFGYAANEIIGESIFKMVPQAYFAQQQALFAKVLRGERIAQLRSRMITQAGNEFPVSLTISPVKDDRGKVIGASHIIRDISMELDAEAKQAILASIIETSEDAIISKTLDGIITSWNVGAEKIFGYKAEEVLGKSILILIPQERTMEEDYILSTIKKGIRIQHFQTSRIAKDGEELPISLTVSPVKDKEGNIIGISKIARNISKERKAAERHEILAAIVESSDDAIISKDLNGIILSWNTGAQKIFGYSEEEVIGRHISILIPAYRLEEENQIISSIKKGVKVDHFQTKRLTKSGKELDISLTVSPIKDLDGNIIGASKVARDITQQKEYECALQKNNEKLKILNDVGRVIAEELGVQTILQKVVDATTQISGAEFGVFFYKTMTAHGEQIMQGRSGISQENLDTIIIPQYANFLERTWAGEPLMRSDDITKDPRYMHIIDASEKTGEVPLVSFMAVPVRSSSGKIIGNLFFGHHQPRMFQLEHEDVIVNLASQVAIALNNSVLFEEIKDLSQKKDEFIAMASHELKTPLTSLKGYLQILLKSVGEGRPKLFVEKSLTMLDKLSTLIGDLFDISKIESGKLQLTMVPVDMSSFVKEIVETTRFLNSSCQINFTTHGHLFIMGDKLRLEQIIYNLLNNAIKYSPEAEIIDVSLYKENDKVILSVQDYGIGIKLEDQALIFSRFYRSENVSQKISGLGLGLYITKEIVERHGGHIFVESVEGKGATFKVEFPVMP